MKPKQCLIDSLTNHSHNILIFLVSIINLFSSDFTPNSTSSPAITSKLMLIKDSSAGILSASQIYYELAHLDVWCFMDDSLPASKFWMLEALLDGLLLQWWTETYQLFRASLKDTPDFMQGSDRVFQLRGCSSSSHPEELMTFAPGTCTKVHATTKVTNTIFDEALKLKYLKSRNEEVNRNVLAIRTTSEEVSTLRGKNCARNVEIYRDTNQIYCERIMRVHVARSGDGTQSVVAGLIAWARLMMAGGSVIKF
ncbi:hypothetical protein L6164_028526 [Bauhinia variegata]|uniref:Uncharacterized protein n=1 Tax=Bauhinia variegata TaxID=167791 RepID=A0ACB9L5V9_BAUVA|nr:hypothetical protein L6164_028526 [Bauhinia variegata]